MHARLHEVGFWLSSATLVLCLLSTALGWNAYRQRSGGDAAGNGMARGFHGLFLIGLNVAAVLGVGCFALARVLPPGAPQLVADILGWLLLLPTMLLFGLLLRW